jgi:uncharacterized membrane protein
MKWIKWIYIFASVAFVVKMLYVPNPIAQLPFSIVKAIAEDSGVSNVVSGIIFRNRLYDTIFEVIVFTIAIMGANFLLANEKPFTKIYQFSDQSSIVLAQLGATVAALVGIELSESGWWFCGRCGRWYSDRLNCDYFPPRTIAKSLQTLARCHLGKSIGVNLYCLVCDNPCRFRASLWTNGRSIQRWDYSNFEYFSSD